MKRKREQRRARAPIERLVCQKWNLHRTLPRCIELKVVIRRVNNVRLRGASTHRWSSGAEGEWWRWRRRQAAGVRSRRRCGRGQRNSVRPDWRRARHWRGARLAPPRPWRADVTWPRARLHDYFCPQLIIAFLCPIICFVLKRKSGFIHTWPIE